MRGRPSYKELRNENFDLKKRNSELENVISNWTKTSMVRAVNAARDSGNFKHHPEVRANALRILNEELMKRLKEREPWKENEKLMKRVKSLEGKVEWLEEVRREFLSHFKGVEEESATYGERGEETNEGDHEIRQEVEGGEETSCGVSDGLCLERGGEDDQK
jgi:vacuolar-type H+-ATPase subunit I/STV1